jgi:hypothetical protein
MELIVENTIEEMQNEIFEQEVFKFHVVEGWRPMDADKDGDNSDVELNAIAVSLKAEETKVEEQRVEEHKVEELDLLSADKMDIEEKGWEKIDITVDSGAAHSVADGNICWPTIRRDESEGSRAGSVYLGPGTERIPNRGQTSLNVRTAGNTAVRKMTFQDAAVRKPLAAVSGITDKGNVVLFDRKGSFIAPEGAPEVQTIRELIKQVKNRIELERKKGVYIMPIWVQTGKTQPTKAKESVFTGQGK